MNPNLIPQFFWHEFHHAYALYGALSKNNGVLPPSIQRTDDNYASNSAMMDVSKGFVNFINRLWYSMDRNEIDAFISQIYSYIRDNIHITSENYKNYLDGIPGYEIVMVLNDGVNVMQKIKDDTFYLKVLKETLNNVYDDSLSVSQVYNRFNNRLIKRRLYAVKQFYKVLGYSLMKLDRTRRLHEHHKLFNEWWRRNNKQK